MATEEKPVDVNPVAELYGTSRDTILRMARQGRIPCIRIGPRTIRFRLSEVRAALEGRRPEAAA